MVVSEHLQEQIMEENPCSHMGAHFSGSRLFNMLSGHWWWEGMCADSVHFASNCPECAVVSGGWQVTNPPLHPIPVQSVGVDIMELPKIEAGNKYILMFQDYLTK